MSSTFKVEVGTFGIQVALPVVLETATDWQLFDLTCDPISNIAVLTGALLLSLLQTRKTHSAQVTPLTETFFIESRPHWCRHGAGGVLVATTIVPGGARVNRHAGEAVSGVALGTGTAHLLTCLSAFGLFGAATVPNVTHVRHCRDRDKRNLDHSGTSPGSSGFSVLIGSSLPVQVYPSPW